MPDEYQPMALEQFSRRLKPGGKFELPEMIHSKNKASRRRQDFFTAFVEKVYGARFDRKTAQYLEQSTTLDITSKRFSKDDVFLLIEGIKKG